MQLFVTHLLISILSNYSTVEKGKPIVAPVVKTGRVCHPPPRRRHLLPPASTTMSLTEKIRVLLHTLATGRPAQLPVNTMRTLT